MERVLRGEGVALVKRWPIALCALSATLALVACRSDSNGAAPAPGEDPGCERGVVTTDSGLEYEDTRCGDGQVAEVGDTLTVHYMGRLQNGKRFDSSRERGAPFTFQLGAGLAIRGWDEGLQGMREGGKRRLVIPAELGYGRAGSPPIIPRNSTVIFAVELLEVQKATD